MRPAERDRLRRAMYSQALRVAALLLVTLLAVLLLLRIGVPVDFDSRGRLELCIVLLAGWAWLLHRAPGRWHAARLDLQIGCVEIVQGRGHLSLRGGFGLIQMSRPVLTVGTLDFNLDPELRRRALAADRLQARYAPRSRILLDIASVDVASVNVAPIDTGPVDADPVDAMPIDVSSADTTPALRPIVAAQDWTDRDRALLAQLALGRSDKLIARHLDLSPATVRTYNSVLFQKLGVNNRRQAVDRARALGLIAVD